MNLSVIVPAYNERNTLGAVIESLRCLPEAVEIVVVDDGSTDGTAAIADDLAGPDLVLVRLPENRGKGHAVRTGIERSSGSIIAIQDADLELDPGRLPEMAEPIRAGEADAVFGTRFAAGVRVSPGCWWGNAALTKVANLVHGGNLTDLSCGQKLFEAHFLRNLGLQAEGFELEAELVVRTLRSGGRIVEISVPYLPRDRGAGKKVRYLRDGWRALRTVLELRSLPAYRASEEGRTVG